MSTHCTPRIIYHCPGLTRSNSIATLLRYSIAEAAVAAKRRGAAAVVAGTHVTWWFTGGGGDDDDVGLGGRKHMDCARCQQHLLGLGRLLPSRRGEVNGLAKLCYPPPPTLTHKLLCTYNVSCTRRPCCIYRRFRSHCCCLLRVQLFIHCAVIIYGCTFYRQSHFHVVTLLL